MTTPVPVSAYGGASGAALLWRRAGQLWLTSIQKVRLRLVADGAATLVPGVEILSSDAPPDAGASRALEVPTDLAPALPGAEVLLAGHACAPSQTQVGSLSVRLIVSRDDTCLVDKTLHVYGDRLEPGAAPLPFVRMPIVYERAVGGPNTDNPVGRALNDRARPPNIVNPVDPWVVAGFGPIATSWPPRRRLVRNPPTFHGPVLEVPEETQLDFFHAAPKDQRAARFFGDEWIVIDGMHPSMPRFSSQLPQMRVRSRLARLGAVASHDDIEMEIARIAIDMDRLLCDVTWRGTARVDAAELGSVRVIGGLEAILEEDSAGPMSGETMMLSEDQLARVMQGQALPWTQGAEETPPPRRSSPGPALMGLPFAPPPTGVAAFEAAPPPPVWVPARSASTDAGAEIFNEVTITSVDDSALAGTPFGQTGARPVVPAFVVPRIGEDPPDDEGAHTSITPAAHNIHRTAPLPFSASGSSPPPPALVAPAPVTRTIVDPGPDDQPLHTAIDMPAVSFDDPILAELGIDAKRSASALPFSKPSTPAPPAIVPPAVVLPAPPALVEPPAPVAPPPVVAPIAVLGVSSIGSPRPSAPPLVVAEPQPIETKVVEAPPPPPAPAEPAPLPKAETGLRKTVVDNVAAQIAMHGMDLTSADLSGLDLSGAILGDAKLDGAKLTGTILKGARLGGSKLIGADLRDADLSEADLAGADLTRANLTGALLDGANLTGVTAALVTAERAKLVRVRADRARFVQAHFEDATLDDASLRDVELSGAFLARATFRRAQLSSARLADAQGEDAVFEESALDGAFFTGASFEGARFDRVTAPRSTWVRATVERATFDGAVLRDTSFARASMPAATFKSADLTKADLSNVLADRADFSEAQLVGCDLRMAKLAEAKLLGATMRDTNAQKVIATAARFEGARMEKVSLRGARMKGADLVNVHLDGADLRDADLEGAKLTGTDLSKAKTAGANLKNVEGLEKKT